MDGSSLQTYCPSGDSQWPSNADTSFSEYGNGHSEDWEVKVPRKNIRISTGILWRVIHILTQAVPYTFISVNRRNNEARTHIASADIRIFLQCRLLLVMHLVVTLKHH